MSIIDTKIKSEKSRESHKSTVQTYARYKDSGIEWLGEIPEHWKVTRLANIGRFSSSGIDKLTKKNESLVKIINYTDVYRNLRFTIDSNIDFMEVTTPESNRLKNLVKKGDLIFLPSSETFEDLGLSALVDENIENLSFSYHVLRFEFTKELFHGFKKYFTNNNTVLNEFSKKGTGSIRKTLGRFDFRNTVVVLPPLQEQTAIANFLDDKTEKIDQAISIKEQQIALLKERKQILIHNAVTKGIRPLSEVEMKDSGVEWIGEIPKHWEIEKLYGICRFVRGNSSFKKDELLSEGKYVALQYGQSYQVNEIDEKYMFYVNDEFYKDSQIVNHGDTILISTSETIEDLGHSVYYNRNDVGLLGGEQILLKPKKEQLNSHYLYLFSKVFSKELRKYATGIKVFRFNIDDLKTIYSTVPPFSEQKEISQYIESASQKIDTAVSLKQQEIEKLKEYKSSLINSVVTGKIKV